VVRRDLDIIESRLRIHPRHAKIRVPQRPNRANCCDIVEGNDRGKGPAVLQQFLNNGVAKLR